MVNLLPIHHSYPILTKNSKQCSQCCEKKITLIENEFLCARCMRIFIKCLEQKNDLEKHRIWKRPGSGNNIESKKN